MRGKKEKRWMKESSHTCERDKLPRAKRVTSDPPSLPDDKDDHVNSASIIEEHNPFPDQRSSPSREELIVIRVVIVSRGGDNDLGRAYRAFSFPFAEA